MTDSMTPSIEMTEHGAYAECDFTPMIDRIAEQVQWRVDHAALEQVAGALEEHGYVKVVRCEDCKIWRNYCEWNPFYNDQDLDEPGGFCAWGKRKEGGE